jgi:hypothetical protein
MPNISAIQNFFFEAMLQGYVDDNAPIGTIPELPGSKTFRFCSPDEKFTLGDIWFGAGQINFGLTIIWEKLVNSRVFIPVWKMSYQGRYQAEAIPVLKEALHAAYSNGVFLGGRGAASWRWRDYVYYNYPDQSDFKSFFGHEKVMHHNGTFIGSHSYEGGILFNPQD